MAHTKITLAHIQYPTPFERHLEYEEESTESRGKEVGEKDELIDDGVIPSVISFGFRKRSPFLMQT